MEWFFVIIFFVGIIVISASKGNSKSEKLKYLREQNKDNVDSNLVKCPKCLSTQISANRRGITVTTGLIGTQKVYITCLQCGHRWKAGKH